MRRWVVSCLVIFLIFSLRGQHHSMAPAEVVVKLDRNAQNYHQLQQELESRFTGSRKIRRTLPGARVEPSVLDGIYKIALPPDRDLVHFCDSLTQLSGIKYAEPVYQEQLLIVPDDPEAQPGASQTYLSVIQAYDAWDVSQSDPDILIGIVDTGLDTDHEDLSLKLFENDDPVNGIDDDGNGFIDDLLGYDFADDDADPEADGNQHGTHVSGIAGARVNNGIGIAGVGYDARISPLKIFRTSDNTSNNAYDAIVYAADNGYDILTLSWGSTGSFSQFNQDVINYAVLEKDVIVVAAAGNTPEDLAFYPASYDHVLSIASTNDEDAKASFSTFHKRVDLTAPGSGIYSTQNDNTYGTDNGTSHSTPMVAGVAALVKHQFPDLNARQVMERIRVTTDDISQIGINSLFEGKLGKGRLNAYRAVTESNLISIRSDAPEIVTPQVSDRFYFGDTISLGFELTNYLDPAINVAVSIDLLSNHLTLLEPPGTVEFVNSLETTTVGPLQLLVGEGTPSDHMMEFLLRFDNGSTYTDWQLFDITSAPNHLDIGNEDMQLTLSGDGSLGFADDGYQNGAGLIWESQTIAREMGVILALDSSTIYDNIPNVTDGARNSDFTNARPIRPENYPGITYISSEFESGTFLIEQSTLRHDTIQGLIVLSYRLTNNSTDTLRDVSFGMFSNFDLGEDAGNDQATFLENTGYMSTPGEDIFAGIRSIGSDSTRATLLDISSFLAASTSFADSMKYNWISTEGPDSLGYDTTLNAGIVKSVFLDSLMPFQSTIQSFLIGVDTSFSDLQQTLVAGEDLFQSFRDNPPILEQFFSCQGGNVEIDPGSGEEFHFFSDPSGLDTLATGDTLIIGPISGDSSIYVSNADEAYSGPIRSLNITLLENIADFRFDSDTFFLGDTPDNSIRFFDDSFLPISWQWDFGNGIQATDIPDPAVSYQSTGHYDVSLQVINHQGCDDQVVKQLIVLERPDVPIIPDQIVCPSGSAILSTGTNDTLRLYLSETSKVILDEGSTLLIDDIQQDTLFFVTRLENSLESARRKVTLTVENTVVTINYSPVADSLSGNFILLELGSVETDSLAWTINDTTIFNQNSPVLPADTTRFDVNVFVTTPNGCEYDISTVITLTPSPAPSVDDVAVCAGDSVLISPGNGTLFAFYRDSTLLQPIARGSTLMFDSLTEDTSLYVVGLDSILPGEPKLVRVDVIDFNPSISADPDTVFLSESREVNLEIEVEGTYQWFVNGNIQGIGDQQTYFFNEATMDTITVEGISPQGCLGSDTVILQVLPERPETVLGLPKNDILTYPNPTTGWLYLHSSVQIVKMEIRDISGKLIKKSEQFSNMINLTKYRNGIYFLTVSFTDRSTKTIRIVLTKP